MPAKTKKNQLVFFIYWVLLAYIVAALVWWFIELSRQNDQMAAFRMQELRKDDIAFSEKASLVEDEKRRKDAQYIGEGFIFLLLILAGAIFVYRSVRRQLKQSLEQQHFMIAITHELKTPIAVAKLNLETLQKRKLEESQQLRLIHNTLQEANRLNALCNNMLLSSQIEAGGYRITNEELNWSEMILQTVEDFLTRYPDRIFVKDIEPGIYVMGDELLLQIALNNLIENAIKYSSKNNEVKISLSQSGLSATLQVTDNGPGIPPEEKLQVFKKFYRVGNEATRSAKGTGLGLYLTHRIIQTHKGSIIINDNPQGGSIFVVTLNSTG